MPSRACSLVLTQIGGISEIERCLRVKSTIHWFGMLALDVRILAANQSA